MKKTLSLMTLVLISSVVRAEVYDNKAVLNAVDGYEVTHKVVEKPVIKDITQSSMCTQAKSDTIGFGHEEISICPDGSSGLKDKEVASGGRKTYWKGNEGIGYYKLRDDGSIDTSTWKMSLQGVLA